MATRTTTTATAEEGGDMRPSTPYDYHRLDSLRSQEHTTEPLPSNSTDDRRPTTRHSPSSYTSPTFSTFPTTASPTSPTSGTSPTSPTSPRSISAAFTPSTPQNRGAARAAFHTDKAPFHADNEPKRDSAIDHSTPNAHCSPTSQSPLNGLQAVTETSTSLPSIVVQDAGPPPKSSYSSRRFLRKFSRDSDRDSNPVPDESTTADYHHHQRLRSFHGIDVDLSSDSGLEDLNEPEKLTFSNRGSVLLNGKKLDAMFANQQQEKTEDTRHDNAGDYREATIRDTEGDMARNTHQGKTQDLTRDNPEDMDRNTTEAYTEDKIRNTAEAHTEDMVRNTTEEHTGDNAQGSAQDKVEDKDQADSPYTFTVTSAPASPQSHLSNVPGNGIGLRTGRRTPSVHMLQAVMQGTRVLSAEEVSFSQRVRTMYEYGDEKAAEWTAPGATTIEMPPPPVMSDAAFEREETPEPELSALRIDNPRRRPQTSAASLPKQSSRFSVISREPYETAGGIEDWEEVPQGAVDRYGFIQPARIFSSDTVGGSSCASPSERTPAPGIQRVTTSLQQLSNNPRDSRRRIFRAPSSSVRHSRSLPPRAPSRSTTRTSGPASSIYSYQSNHSSTRVTNPFRSRDRRALEEAPDMLTLPPYLSNITETETSASAPSYPDVLKRREWAREGKWRKMAHLVPSTVKGGGMKFDFDVNDPKLIARTWKGIPDRWRATAWHSFLSSSSRKRGNYSSDDTLIRLFSKYQEESSADDVQIDVDVPRTINLHIMFRRRYRGGQRLLFRVLHAISLHFPTTGYVQGMATLAATLLCYFDEEMAFVMLVRMWQLRGLEELYRSGFEGLMAALEEFKTKWLANDSDIAEKLTDLGIDPTSYGTRWYLTLFNMSIPFAAQLRIWDVFMLLGDAPTSSGTAPPQLYKTPTAATGSPQQEQQQQARQQPQQNGLFGGADLSILHAASSALVEAMRGVLLDSDFENGMKTLTSWIPVQDEDLLMRVARVEWKIGMRNRRREARAIS